MAKVVFRPTLIAAEEAAAKANQVKEAKDRALPGPKPKKTKDSAKVQEAVVLKPPVQREPDEMFSYDKVVPVNTKSAADAAEALGDGAGFVEWVREMAPDEIAGWVPDPTRHPVRRYLESMGYKDIDVYRRHLVSYTRFPGGFIREEVPAWLLRLTTELTDFKSAHPVTASQVLRAFGPVG